MGMLDEMMRKFNTDCLSPIERLVFTLFDSDVNRIDIVWTDALGMETLRVAQSSIMMFSISK